ncbi:MAG: right-handed parallel beta-helix repeat-containing protein [Limnohabitans sp.]|nr:right-handed parallel beta-helix repeat-containing protein [Limnohabitans sp.]
MSFSASAGQISCPSGNYPLPCDGQIGVALTASFTPLAFEVPTQYPTIQAAIDATPAGTARTINVLAGTYNQSFSLNGKNVIVRGAAGNTTILNGAGLTTSIATFTGGEPATAGVENLVFRNGIAGRAINPPSYNFTGGGGIFGKDSSAFVRNCRFEDCGADFGAGIYMLRCTVDVDGCVFSSNDATTDGGGMQTYACSGVVKNSTFTGNRCALSYAGSGSAFKGVGIRIAGTTLALQACTISGNPIPNAGAAVEYFENVKVLSGVLRLVDTDIVSNTVGSGSIDDAGALRILGRQQSCILSAGTTICTNTPRNVVGPYLVEGAATVCDCEADFSGNGQVDAADLGILLSVWGTSPANGQGDLNHDGIVSAPDLSALLARWGPCS